MSSGGDESGGVLLSLARALAAYGATAAANAGRRAAVVVVGYVAVACLFAISLFFFTLSGYRAISLAMGNIYASLIVGCIYLVVGLVVTLVVLARRR